MFCPRLQHFIVRSELNIFCYRNFISHSILVFGMLLCFNPLLQGEEKFAPFIGTIPLIYLNFTKSPGQFIQRTTKSLTFFTIQKTILMSPQMRFKILKKKCSYIHSLIVHNPQLSELRKPLRSIFLQHSQTFPISKYLALPFSSTAVLLILLLLLLLLLSLLF